MEVDLDGLTVRAPRWVTLCRDRSGAGRARALDREGAGGVARPPPRRDAARVEIAARRSSIRGRELALEVYPARQIRIAPDLFHLTVLHPRAQDETQVAELVGKWLQDEALRLVAPQVASYARRVTALAPTVRLSNARSEWGSCNARGEIRLNWRLVQLPPALAEYVVAHEVAHLVELNHSPRFWAMVETLMPGHAALRRELEDWTALLAA